MFDCIEYRATSNSSRYKGDGISFTIYWEDIDSDGDCSGEVSLYNGVMGADYLAF